MEITVTGRVKQFGDIKKGKVFRSGEGTTYCVYIKTEEIKREKGYRPYNAVELKSGEMYSFADDHTIEIPKDAQCVTKW